MSVLQANPVIRTRLAFALLAAVQMTLISGITVVNVALPVVQRELDLTDGRLALITSAYGLSFSGLLLLGGRLADLHGRRRLLGSGVAVFGAASALSAVAPDFWTLLLARFAQGVGAAMAAPAAIAMLSLICPDPARRSRMLAVWGGLSGIGAILGTLLSGVVSQWMSWRWTFVVLVAVAGTVLAAMPRLLPADGPASDRRLDVPGAVLATGGLTTFSYGLLEDATVILLVGVLLLAGFLLVESRVAAPLVPLPFFASRQRAVALAAIVLGSAGMATSFFFLALHLQQDRGLSPLQTTAVFLPYGVVLIATGATAGRLAVRYGAHALLVAGLSVATVGLALLATFDAVLLGLALLVLPLGIGLTFSAATVTVMADAPHEQAGLAGGMVNTAMEVGPTAGLAVLVAAASAHAGGYGFALAAAAVVFAGTALLAVMLLRPRIRK